MLTVKGNVEILRSPVKEPTITEGKPPYWKQQQALQWLAAFRAWDGVRCMWYCLWWPRVKKIGQLLPQFCKTKCPSSHKSLQHSRFPVYAKRVIVWNILKFPYYVQMTWVKTVRQRTWWLHTQILLKSHFLASSKLLVVQHCNVCHRHLLLRFHRHSDKSSDSKISN